MTKFIIIATSYNWGINDVTTDEASTIGGSDGCEFDGGEERI